MLKSSSPVLVYFYRNYTEACKLVSPLVANIAESYKGKIKVLKIDSYVNSNVADKYKAGLFHVPVLVLFKDGVERGRIKGTTSTPTIAHLIERPDDFKVEDDRRDPEGLAPVSKTLAAIPGVLDSDFDSEIKSVIPTLVFFYEDNDKTCKLMASTVSEIAKQYKDRIKVVRIDTSINRSTMYSYRAYGTGSSSTVILFRGGKVKDRKDGAFSKAAVAKMIDKVLATR